MFMLELMSNLLGEENAVNNSERFYVHSTVEFEVFFERRKISQ